MVVVVAAVAVVLAVLLVRSQPPPPPPAPPRLPFLLVAVDVLSDVPSSRSCRFEDEEDFDLCLFDFDFVDDFLCFLSLLLLPLSFVIVIVPFF